MNPSIKARIALAALGAQLLIIAALEFMALQNGLFKIFFFWSYLVCLPAATILILSLLEVKLPGWKSLSAPSAMFCLLMPFCCWQERTLSECVYDYVCCQLVFIAAYWLFFAVVSMLREACPGHAALKWLRQLVLYGMLVPSCALAMANLGTICKDGRCALPSIGFLVLWGRLNLEMPAIRYFLLAGMTLVGLFCIFTRIPDACGEKSMEA